LSSPSFNRDSELEFAARLRGDIPDVSSLPLRTEATVSWIMLIVELFEDRREMCSVGKVEQPAAKLNSGDSCSFLL
jgi:hypothetical protein